LTGIPQATLSAIENDRLRLGVERAKVLARALKCHPAVLCFPAGRPWLSLRHNRSFNPTAKELRFLVPSLRFLVPSLRFLVPSLRSAAG
jgi:Helix-turn-helix